MFRVQTPDFQARVLNIAGVARGRCQKTKSYIFRRISCGLTNGYIFACIFLLTCLHFELLKKKNALCVMNITTLEHRSAQ